MSVFEVINTESQDSKKFWMPDARQSWPETYKNTVYQYAKSGEFKSANLLLSENYLIKVGPKSVNKKTLLDWKVIEPFIEESDEDSRFGFSVGHRGCQKDFYVQNQETLDTWIEHLSKVAIMTDLENDFSLIKDLGNGSFGTVYLAENIDTAEMFAVKSISKHSITASQTGLANLMNEIRYMRMLKHPYIVKLHYVYESATHIYLVIDYVEGGSLFTRIIKRKVFSEKTAAKFAERFLDVLNYLSSVNIVHRDIKLENILMVSEDNDYNFKLADFGLAGDTSEKLNLRCGSPGYIAPEILRKCYYDSKVDVFSAGVILYILLSGRMPFSGKTTQDIILRNRDCKISFSQEAWKNVSRHATSLILRLTEPTPSFRPSAKDALSDPWFEHQLNSILPQLYPSPKDSTKVKLCHKI